MIQSETEFKQIDIIGEFRHSGEIFKVLFLIYD